MKLISIVTINYNNANGLLKTLQSVAQQSYRAIDYIVIDGGSNDASKTHITTFLPHINYWVSEPDKGIYHAMNKGIKVAQGQYLLFLNSGDFLADDTVIERILPHLQNTDIVYGDLFLCKNETRVREQSPNRIGVYELMLSTIWHPTAFINRELFDKYGAYNETLSITADYEFFIRSIIKHKASTRHVEIATAVFDLSGISNKPEFIQKQEAQRLESWKLNVTPFRLLLYKCYFWLKRRYLYYTHQLQK